MNAKVSPLRVAATLAAALLLASVPMAAQVPWPAPRIANAQPITRVIAPGAVHHTFPRTRWGRIDILETDARRCRLAAPKAGGRATGRAPVAASLADYARQHPDRRVVGGVNGDLFKRHGVPVGIYIHQGNVISGNDGPLATWHELTVDPFGVARIERIQTGGTMTSNGTTIALTGHNYAPSGGVTLVSRERGDSIHLAAGSVVATVRGNGSTGYLVHSVTTLAGETGVPIDSFLVVAGPRSPARNQVAGLVPGALVEFATRFSSPRAEAVGGFPVLVHGGQVTSRRYLNERDTGRDRVERTAVALLDGGRRQWLVTVGADHGGGGITFVDLAELLRGLGAEEALNLDGGPSTWMELQDRSGVGAFRAPYTYRGNPPNVSVAVAADCAPASS